MHSTSPWKNRSGRSTFNRANLPIGPINHGRFVWSGCSVLLGQGHSYLWVWRQGWKGSKFCNLSIWFIPHFLVVIFSWKTFPKLNCPPLIMSTYPSAHQQALAAMACLYHHGAQCWWVIPTNCSVMPPPKSPTWDHFISATRQNGAHILHTIMMKKNQILMMRRNHLIPVTKQNQFHSFAYSHGWKETDFYEQMTPNWRQELYIEEAQLISFLQKRNEKGRG